METEINNYINVEELLTRELEQMTYFSKKIAKPKDVILYGNQYKEYFDEGMGPFQLKKEVAKFDKVLKLIGDAHQAEKQIIEAIQEYEEITNKSEDDLSGLHQLYESIDDIENADRILESLIRLAHRSNYSLLKQAERLERQEKFNEAYQKFKQYNV